MVRWERGEVGSSSSDEDDIVGLLLWEGMAFGGVGRLDLVVEWL